MYRTFSIVFLLTILITPSIANADWFDDFESAMSGDTLGALGYFNEYEIEQVSPDGVNGSHGVKVSTPLGFGWPGAWIYGQPGIQNVGDSIEISIDVAFQNAQQYTGAFQDFTPCIEFVIANMNDFSRQLYPQFVRKDVDSNYQEYQLHLADSSPTGGQSFLSSARPVAELGISQNVPLEISDFFTLRFFARKTGANLYTVNFEVLDLDGNVLNSMELVDQPLDATLNSNQLALKFGHLGDFTWRVHDNIRFDNFRYQLTSTTETSLSPTALNVTRGQGVNTDVNRLAENDNVDVSIRSSNSDIQSRTEFEFGLISPVTIPSLLEVTIDGSVFARSTVTQTLEMFNHATQSWEIIDLRFASRLVDTTITVPLAGDLSRFVANQTNEIQARIRFQSNENRQSFSSNTDQILFRIGY